MAHFAELNENNIVLRVIVVNNNELLIDGKESEEKGISFCRSLFGENTLWKQCSYNKTFRKNFGGPGFTYNEQLDAFIEPQPFDSWTLNETTCQWEAPTPYPAFDEENPKFYTWNEEILNWEEIQVSE